MDNKKIISKFGKINNISHVVINELSVGGITDNEVLEQTELIENKLIEIRLAIAEDFSGEDERNEAECIDHEINIMLDQIKEEFFDSRVRMYELTKMGLIQLFPFIKDDMKLEFMQHIRNESTILMKV